MRKNGMRSYRGHQRGALDVAEIKRLACSKLVEYANVRVLRRDGFKEFPNPGLKFFSRGRRLVEHGVQYASVRGRVDVGRNQVHSPAAFEALV
jgi:hypothetical protein